MRAVKSVLMTAKNLKYQATRKASKGNPLQERKGSIISQGGITTPSAIQYPSDLNTAKLDTDKLKGHNELFR